MISTRQPGNSAYRACQPLVVSWAPQSRQMWISNPQSKTTAECPQMPQVAKVIDALGATGGSGGGFRSFRMVQRTHSTMASWWDSHPGDSTWDDCRSELAALNVLQLIDEATYAN